MDGPSPSDSSNGTHSTETQPSPISDGTPTGRPILVMTHPRSCSTAFSRVFLTQRDTLEYFHETISDAYWFGPERSAERTVDDAALCARSGLAHVTYQHVLAQFAATSARGKRPFIKDMAYSIVPPHEYRSSTDTGTTFVMLPDDVLRQFTWAFLIRHPRRAIPSLCRCMTPPLSTITGFSGLLRSDVGIEPLRELLDYLLQKKIITPENAVVLDADGLLDRPEETISGLCERVGIEFDAERMLKWTQADRDVAEEMFAKWRGWHEDALESDCLRARTCKKKDLTPAQEDEAWAKTYGDDMARLIRKYVDENVAHYEHMRAFAYNV